MNRSSLNPAAFNQRDLLHRTAARVRVYLFEEAVSADTLPELIHKVYSALVQEVALCALKPAVPIEDSIKDDYLVCLEDGEPFKMLKRHLKSAHKMTPDDYRLRWGLSADYPMVALSYANKRRVLAKALGFGQSNVKTSSFMHASNI